MAEKKQKKQEAKSLTTKRSAVASKKTMNLAFHESSINPKKLIPLVLAIIVASLLFVKFGFIDQNNKKLAALDELSQKQTTLAAINVKLAGYDELAAQYGRYSYGWMTEKESSLVDRMDVLKILEEIMDRTAIIEDFAVNNNILAVNISGLTLDQTSALVHELEEDELVQDVTVYAAKSEGEDKDAEDEEAEEEGSKLNAQVAMTIILAKEEQ